MEQKVIKSVEMTPSQKKAVIFHPCVKQFVAINQGAKVTTYIKPNTKNSIQFHIQRDDLKQSITLIVGKRGKIDSVQVVER